MFVQVPGTYTLVQSDDIQIVKVVAELELVDEVVFPETSSDEFKFKKTLNVNVASLVGYMEIILPIFNEKDDEGEDKKKDDTASEKSDSDDDSKDTDDDEGEDSGFNNERKLVIAVDVFDSITFDVPSSEKTLSFEEELTKLENSKSSKKRARAESIRQRVGYYFDHLRMQEALTNLEAQSSSGDNEEETETNSRINVAIQELRGKLAKSTERNTGRKAVISQLNKTEKFVDIEEIKDIIDQYVSSAAVDQLETLMNLKAQDLMAMINGSE